MHVVFYFKAADQITHSIQERKSYPVADLKEAVSVVQALYLKPEFGRVAGFKYDGGTKVGSVNTIEVLYVETIDND